MLTSFLSIFVFLNVLQAQTLPKPPREKRVQTHATVDYFNTTANYGNAGGSFQDLPNGGSYKNILMRFGAAYDLDPQWHLLGSLLVSKATSEDSVTTRDTVGVSEIGFGAQYWFMKQPFWVIPEFKFTYPLQRVSASTDDIIIGEGAMSFEGGAWLGKKIGTMRGYGYLGAKYQDEGRAMLLPWTLAAEFRPEQWFIDGGLRGYETIKESADSRAEHEFVTNRVNGGSLRYYAVNPSSREVFAELGMHNKDWSAWVGVSQTFNGEESAAGMTVSVGGLLNMDFLGGGGSSSEEDPEPDHEVSAPQKQPKFDYGGEKYDEDLFKSSSPVRPEDQLHQEEKPVQKVKRVKKKKVKPKQTSPKTEQLLDDTEKKLEEQM